MRDSKEIDLDPKYFYFIFLVGSIYEKSPKSMFCRFVYDCYFELKKLIGNVLFWDGLLIQSVSLYRVFVFESDCMCAREKEKER